MKEIDFDYYHYDTKTSEYKKIFLNIKVENCSTIKVWNKKINDLKKLEELRYKSYLKKEESIKRWKEIFKILRATKDKEFFFITDDFRYYKYEFDYTTEGLSVNLVSDDYFKAHNLKDLRKEGRPIYEKMEMMDNANRRYTICKGAFLYALNEYFKKNKIFNKKSFHYNFYHRVKINNRFYFLTEKKGTLYYNLETEELNEVNIE